MHLRYYEMFVEKEEQTCLFVSQRLPKGLDSIQGRFILAVILGMRKEISTRPGLFKLHRGYQ